MSKYRIQPCPYCGKRQRVYPPVKGSPRYQQCNAWIKKYKGCSEYFYVNDDGSVRKLTEEEGKALGKAWVSMVKSLGKAAILVGAKES